MRFPKLTRKTVITLIAVLLVCVIGSSFAAADDGGVNAGWGVSLVDTWWSVVPPVAAIALALITKEVYLSLFLGIAVGSLFLAQWNPLGMMENIFSADYGMVAAIGDSYNVGIAIFLVMLGTVGALCYKAGGSAAYGKWAEKNIKSRTSAQMATFGLGVLIFVDDYFNCLTVGSVMRPVTDKHQISRAKLAYLIDSTAAPVCIIAPISSWAAAVAGSLEETGGFGAFQLFMNSIPFNFYALLTLTFIVCITLMKFDFGPMKVHEDNAAKGDLFTTGNEYEGAQDDNYNKNGKTADLIVPIIVLIVCCVAGLLYNGGWTLFGGDLNFQEAFSNTDASVGLVLGSFVALVFMLIWFLARKVLTLKEYGSALAVGFRDMVPALLILIMAWTLKNITLELGLRNIVAAFITDTAPGLQKFLPAIVCLIAMALSFATGTSWGTFGMLLPIVIAVFPFDATLGANQLAFVGIASALSGAVFGDHCSPISDTTIMASAGAQSNHVNHVTTQAPYALIVGGMSVIFFLVAGFLPVWYIVLPIAIAAMIGLCFILKAVYKGKDAKVA